MDEKERKRREDFLKSQEPFRRNAFKIIKKMMDWCNMTEGSKKFVDEILHSIFSLGKINNPQFLPEMIFADDKQILENLKERYPKPFELYSTQLPKRSPFSCVLDMIVLQKGQTNENQIIQSLRDLIKELEPKFLVSSTICVSQKSNISNLERHYGVSMSTFGPNPGQIVIAASCLSIWDDYVAGAVMTYYPKKEKKTYFDGTIKLPEAVRCQAFSLWKEESLSPCKSCANLFGLQTTDNKQWPYGNCAEAESVSNLLKKENDVKEKAKPKSPTCTYENRNEAKASVEKELKRLLGMVQFKKWDGNYYTPQTNFS
ncbi:uncharacterized protein LOC128374218 [Scomber japonicus]|uniref:uncharacterized protein LOC128374218 n=1 Tax=Scomber japonicus TaxID=13676 RepID=UPI002304D746|nr:uncharacterized protein LOC128374218 [Scomber japonicus]